MKIMGKKTKSCLFILLLSSFFFLTAIHAKQVIYVYDGPGASEGSLKHTLHTLYKTVNLSKNSIETIGPEKIKNENWEKNAVLFIMPGGADIPYLQNLSPNGNKKIRNFVENGGNYLGICAGAYYAGDQIEFAKNTDMEVVGPRELGFFSGIVKGPVLAKYDYNSCSGCRLAELHWQQDVLFPKGTVLYSFYNGGGYFVEADKKENTQVLASYKTSNGLKPAIIKINIGKGNVILSGPHWEYEPSLLDPNDSYLTTIIPTLKETQEERLALARHLLEHLGVRVESN